MKYALMFCPTDEEFNVVVASYPEVARHYTKTQQQWERWTAFHRQGIPVVISNREDTSDDMAYMVKHVLGNTKVTELHVMTEGTGIESRLVLKLVTFLCLRLPGAVVIVDPPSTTNDC